MTVPFHLVQGPHAILARLALLLPTSNIYCALSSNVTTAPIFVPNMTQADLRKQLDMLMAQANQTNKAIALIAAQLNDPADEPNAEPMQVAQPRAPNTPVSSVPQVFGATAPSANANNPSDTSKLHHPKFNLKDYAQPAKWSAGRDFNLAELLGLTPVQWGVFWGKQRHRFASAG
ncbi:hypothetical protein CTheo_9117 [Ceratobasidium theobromae]|uniref:Uncharacterized protein n=1 Tax=Ceratobasidium theobromae TaxID=1582974 RepID=A0A5N5Q6E5_9AGAM|nr:hypothetical protein CTheo_9117 [Ceratobasidium theobromae]